MARWGELESENPDLAALVRSSFEQGRHSTMATIRRDGSPRISGVEVQFVAGDVWVGSMPGSLKAGDLRRDPRLALHSPSPDPALDDPTDWVGDAKLAGRAVEVPPGPARREYLEALAERYPDMPEGEFDLFRLEVAEVVATRIGDPADHLRLEMWHEGGGRRTVARH